MGKFLLSEFTDFDDEEQVAECGEPGDFEDPPHYCPFTDECGELGAPWCWAAWGLA